MPKNKRPKSSESNGQLSLFPEETLTKSANQPDTMPLSEEADLEAVYMQMSAEELESTVAYHNKLYNEGNPIISDELYDRIVKRLSVLAPDSRVSASLTSPSVSAGGKIIHTVPMLSLAKAYTVTEIADWLAKFDGDFIASPKIDGLACSIQYDAEGNIAAASTRGDGHEGDDITANVRYIKAIPHHIDMPGLEVRGEVYMPISAFEAFEGIKKSPRNLAVGGLKQKTPADTAKYGLSFFAYEAVGHDYQTEHEKYDALRQLGFTPVAYTLFHRPAMPAPSSDAPAQRHAIMREISEQIESYCRTETENRPNWNFDADGLVFKADDTRVQKSMGMTDHHPKCAIAFKFAGDEGETVLTGVEWQVAKSGIITPVASFAPLLLSGALVKRASLSNAAQVESFPADASLFPPETNASDRQLHLKLGAGLLVSRRGGVIPHAEKILSFDSNAPDIEIPDKCPSCGAPAMRDGLFLKCTDPDNCPSTGQALIENYVKAIGCLGFGEKIIANLYDSGSVKTPADLYKLTVQDIALAVAQSEDGAVDPDAVLPQKLFNAIQNTKSVPLDVFLESLSIPALGHVNSQTVAKKLMTVENVRSASPDTLFEVLEYAVKTVPKDTGEKYLQKMHEKTPRPGESARDFVSRAITKKTEHIQYLTDTFTETDALYHASASAIQRCIEQGTRRTQIDSAAIIRAILRGLKQRSDLIDDLLGFIHIEEKTAAPSAQNGPFAGMSFLFTGSLESMKRDEAQARVEALGGKAASGVSKTLSVLVASSNTSSKWKKAVDLNQKGANILLWTEADFLEHLKMHE